MTALKTFAKYTFAAGLVTALTAFTLIVTLLNPWCGLLLVSNLLLTTIVINNALDARQEAAHLDAEEREDLARQKRRDELVPVLGRNWWTK